MLYRTIGIQLGIWLFLGSLLIGFWSVGTASQTCLADNHANKWDEWMINPLTPVMAMQVEHTLLPLSSGDNGSSCEIILEPQIGYFNGQYNLGGVYMPDHPLRLLAGELVKVKIAFDDPPRQVDISLGSTQVTLFGHPGRTYYEVELNAPEDYYSLSLSGERLAPSLYLHVEANFWHDHTLNLSETLPSIEISGHINHLIQVVPAEN